MIQVQAFRPSYCARIALALLFVALADIFFYGQPIGISLFLFGLLLAVAISATHPGNRRIGELVLSAVGVLAALLPLVENVSALSVCVSMVGLVLFALLTAGRLRRHVARAAGQVLLFLLAMPFRLPVDFFRWRRISRRVGGRKLRFVALLVWIVPLTLGAVFLLLFGAANPVIDYWFSLIDLWAWLEYLQPQRLVFWLFVLMFVWAFLRPRLPRFFARLRRPTPAPASPGVDDVIAIPPAEALLEKGPAAPLLGIEQILFGKAAIFRALIVFNLLFAVQTALDAAYLWGGLALPDGLSYAAYAHRGAYPLIVTALLAAGFVLAALRPGSATAADGAIRWLVYFWVAQNIWLVVSSILRLDLYVSIYALTYWRVAAFVWMGLVAFGLVLIVARIALQKSSGWLLSANLSTLSATLYACCLINFAALIANYNVDHCFQMSGQGANLDFWYLRSLGPGAFPAIDRLLPHSPTVEIYGYDLNELHAADVAQYRLEQRNWRAWSFRDWRLLRYLDGHNSATVPYNSVEPHPGW